MPGPNPLAQLAEHLGLNKNDTVSFVAEIADTLAPNSGLGDRVRDSLTEEKDETLAAAPDAAPVQTKEKTADQELTQFVTALIERLLTLSKEETKTPQAAADAMPVGLLKEAAQVSQKEAEESKAEKKAPEIEIKLTEKPKPEEKKIVKIVEEKKDEASEVQRIAKAQREGVVEISTKGTGEGERKVTLVVGDAGVGGASPIDDRTRQYNQRVERAVSNEALAGTASREQVSAQRQGIFRNPSSEMIDINPLCIGRGPAAAEIATQVTPAADSSASYNPSLGG